MPLGSGDQIDFTADVGAHTLMANCGDCTDQITWHEIPTALLAAARLLFLVGQGASQHLNPVTPSLSSSSEGCV